MKRRFPPNEDEIRFLFLVDQLLQPPLCSLTRKRFTAVLLGIDIAVPTLQVAAGQYVEEYVPGVLLELYGFCHNGKP
jgi:hypothetical protein